MEKDPNAVLKSDLKRLVNPNPDFNSTYRAATKFAEVVKLFGMEVLGIYLQTPDGSATKPVEDYLPVLHADRGLNFWVDIKYPGEAVGVDENGKPTSFEMSNLGETINAFRQRLKSANAIDAVGSLYDEGADPKAIVANLIFAWPEALTVLDKMIADKITTIFVAENQYDPTL